MDDHPTVLYHGCRFIQRYNTFCAFDWPNLTQLKEIIKNPFFGHTVIAQIAYKNIEDVDAFFGDYHCSPLGPLETEGETYEQYKRNVDKLREKYDMNQLKIRDMINEREAFFNVLQVNISPSIRMKVFFTTGGSHMYDPIIIIDRDIGTDLPANRQREEGRAT